MKKRLLILLWRFLLKEYDTLELPIGKSSVKAGPDVLTVTKDKGTNPWI